MTQRVGRVSWIVPALVLCAGWGVAAGPDCSNAAEPLRLRVGEQVELGDLVLELDVRIDREAASDLSGETLPVALELRAMHGRAVARGRAPGSFIPRLEVDYRLSGLLRDLARGKLHSRIGRLGAVYGVTLQLESPDRSTGLALELELRQASGPGPTPLSSVRCLPRILRIEIRPEDFEAALAIGLAPRAPADDANFNLLSAFDPLPASSYSDVWGYSDGSTYLAIMGSTNGTLFIDVTDPTDPVQVGLVPGPGSSWRDIKTYQNYAYIGTEGTGADQGVQIVDLSNPLAPVQVGTYTQTVNTTHNIYIDESTGQAWILGTDDGTRILDLTQDPEAPVEIGSWTDRYVHDAFISGNRVYFSEIFSGLHEILDSSNPANLQVISSWTTPGAFTHNSWPNDSRSLLVTTDEVVGGHVAVYDISNELGPMPLLGEYEPDSSAIVHNVFFDDEDNERIVISHYNLGVKIVDLHVPSLPVELASFDTVPATDSGGGGVWGVYPYDPRGYIYASDIGTGLYVLELAPTGGTLSGVVKNAQTGLPIPGAEILELSEGTQIPTDSQGLFAIYAAGGDVRLRVRAPGFSTQIVAAGQLLPGGRVDAVIELEPLPLFPLSGVVRRSDNQVPIQDALVRVVGTQVQATSAADGSFTLPQVASGQRIVTAERFGFASSRIRVVVGSSTPSTTLELEPGIFVDDVESDQGWSLNNTGDTATSGEWERVDPNGTAGGSVQPEDDRTPAPGVAAFITGQSLPGAGIEADDVDGGFTTLTSPLINLLGQGAARVGYHRWVSTDAGSISPGGSLLVEISANNGANWEAVEFVNSEAAGWARNDFNVGSFLSLTNKFRVRFRAEASSGNEQLKVLEVGVDDVEVVRACLPLFNPGQADGDADELLDACDSCPTDPANDADGDGICGDLDNAPFVSNLGQGDQDADQVGDAADNCAATPNTDQRDLDGDGEGDLCDSDMDGDGIVDVGDPDRDDDGVPDLVDLCPTVPDGLQDDDDLDGEGNACDVDDGVVRGLRWDGTLLSWDAELDGERYNVYRGELGAEVLAGFSSCRAGRVVTRYFVDPELPAPGDGFIFLVSRIASGAEGSLGLKSSGEPRAVTGVCQ